MAERWPIVFPKKEFSYFLNSKMAYKLVFVVPAIELHMDDFWNIREALVMQDTFNILQLGIAWLLSSNSLSLVVFILEFLQPQPDRADASLVGSLVC